MKKYINLFILISLFVINAMSFSNDDKKEEVSVVKDISDFLSFEQEIIDLNNEVIKANNVVPLSLSNSNEKEKIEDNNEFELKRLMVRGDVKETYNALKVINYQNLHILCYESEEKTKYAYEELSKDDSLSVVIDKVQDVEEYAEKEYDYSSNKNWGAESIDIGGYKEFLEDYNVKKEAVVVVLDTGINTSHPMFENRLLKNSNGKVRGFSYYDSTYRYSYNNLGFDVDILSTSINENDSNKYSFEDDRGHGTHVAGIICSLTPENVKIFPIKIGNNEGKSTTTIMTAAYLRVINIYSKQFNVVSTNLSYTGGGKSSEDERDTYNKECYEPLLKLNIIPVTAAGNDNKENNIEGLKAIVVSALKEKGNKYVFDNGYSNYGKMVDISAPGTNIVSAAIADSDKGSSSYVSNSGTSMASPQVAGVIALLSLNPKLSSNYSYTEIENMLYNSALEAGELGKDSYYGVGILSLKYFETVATETLSFYKDGKRVDKYTENENFTDKFTLEIDCSDDDYKIIYTTDNSIPSYTSNYYTGQMTFNTSVSIYAMGIKIENNEIVERTNLYHISYFYALTPLEDCISINSSGRISDYTGNFSTLVIPQKLHGITVKSVDPSTFKGSNLEHITLPSTVDTLGGYVFQDSPKLKYVYAPSVKKIYIAAFYNCNSITFVTDTHPEEGATEGVYLPSLEETIGTSFANNKNLESVSLSKLKTLGEHGFDFYETPNLKNAYLPLITSIPEYTFYNSGLSNTFEIGEHVETIASNAFSNTNIKEFVVNKNNKNFYSDGLALYSKSELIAFAFNNKNINYQILSNVVIDSKQHSITSIGERSMMSAILNNLTIPSTITNIEGFAFSKSSIKTLYYNATNCTHTGYLEDGWRSQVFNEIDTIQIGSNVKSVPRSLFQDVDFNDLIINSNSTILEQNSFYRTKEQKPFTKLVLDFNETLSDNYISMLVKSSMFINEGGNAIYSKNLISNSKLMKLDTFNYKYNDGTYYIYSKTDMSKKYLINATSNDFGTISPSGDNYVSEGDSITFTFTPNNGYKINSIIIDGVALSDRELLNAINEGYTFNNVVRNHTISVTFTPKTYNITYIDINGDVIKNLQPNSYIFGSVVKLPILNVKDGYEFIGWYDNDEYIGNSITTIKANDYGNKVYYAKVKLKKYKIDIIASSNGYIRSNSSIYEHGSNVTFTITPNNGYYIEYLLIDGNKYYADDLSNYTFVNLSSNHTISVVFAPKTYNIMYVDMDGVVINNLLPNSYVFGNIVKLPVLDVEDGYEFIGWYDNDEYNGNSITMIKANEYGDKIYYAKIDLKKYEIKIVDSIHGTIYSDKQIYNYGEDATFKIVADKGYHIEYLLIDGEKHYSSHLSSYTFMSIRKDHTISAMFAPNNGIKYTVKHFKESMDSTGQYFINNKYYDLVNIEVLENGVVEEYTRVHPLKYEGYINLEIKQEYVLGDESTVVNVYYIRDTFKLYLSSTEGIYSVNGQGSYLYGETVQVSAKVLEGYVFDKWDSTDSAIQDSDNIVYTFKMPSFPLELKAIAKKEKCLVLISTGENGTTTPNGNINVDCEIGLELTIQPDEGYKLRDILVNGKNKNSEVIENKISIKEIQGKFVTVTATFEKIKYKVDMEIVGNGRVESEHDLNDIEYGENVILNLISYSTHEVKEVYVNDTLYNLEDLKIELNEIKSNIKIKIIFEEIKKEQITVEKGGFSCSKKENSNGGIFDFMLTMFTVVLFMFIKKRIYK